MYVFSIDRRKLFQQIEEKTSYRSFCGIKFVCYYKINNKNKGHTASKSAEAFLRYICTENLLHS